MSKNIGNNTDANKSRVIYRVLFIMAYILLSILALYFVIEFVAAISYVRIPGLYLYTVSQYTYIIGAGIKFGITLITVIPLVYLQKYLISKKRGANDE